jgi:hypothetical protein
VSDAARQTADRSPVTCLACGREFRGPRGLATHVGMTHGPASGYRALRAEAARFGLTVPWMRRLVATHEAGHAVTASTLGLPVKAVTLTPADGMPGGFDFSYTGRTIDAAAVALTAGERAQDRWLRDLGLWTPERAAECVDNGSYDRDRVAALPWPDAAPEREALALRADRVLDAHWDRVSAVADALVQRGTLGPADVTRLAGPRVVWSRQRPLGLTAR